MKKHAYATTPDRELLEKRGLMKFGSIFGLTFMGFCLAFMIYVKHANGLRIITCLLPAFVPMISSWRQIEKEIKSRKL